MVPQHIAVCLQENQQKLWILKNPEGLGSLSTSTYKLYIGSKKLSSSDSLIEMIADLVMSCAVFHTNVYTCKATIDFIRLFVGKQTLSVSKKSKKIGFRIMQQILFSLVHHWLKARIIQPCETYRISSYKQLSLIARCVIVEIC